MSGPDIASQNWDEAQCKRALAQAERLQEQIDDLRFTIPRVVQPLNNTQIKDNPAFFSVYKQVVTACQNDFHSFRTNWMSEEFQKILEHSKESLKANSDLSASVQVPEYGWIRRESAEAEAARRRKDHGPKSDDSATTLDKESISGILGDFQKAHPQIKVEAKDDNRDLLIQVEAGGLELKFHIVISQEANGRDKLSAECLGTAKPFSTISNCVSSRPRANDLKYLLDMIAAYKTVKATSCAKCHRLLDGTGRRPTARRSKQSTNENGTTEIVWEAFHAGCLD